MVEETQRRYPDKAVEVWSQDEARLGLKPVLRRVWALRGQRPLGLHRTRYEWLYIYFFVRPGSGRSYFLLLPTVNTELMNLALREFVRDVNPEGEKVIVLLLDNAGWHRGLEVPTGLILLRLPAYTPELSPAEPVIPLIREAVANEQLPMSTGACRGPMALYCLEALEERLVERGLYLQHHPEIIRFTHQP